MKIRNYEKKDLITILIIILVILEFISIIFLISNKSYTYKKLTGIVMKDNLVTMILSKEERKFIYSNKTIYLNDKLLKYSIKEDRGVILKKNNKKYYELLINVKFSKNIKANEVLNFSIKDKKKTLIEILKDIWEGG